MRTFATLAALSLPLATHAQCQGWLQQQPGTNFNDAVYAMGTWDPDGAGPLSPWLIVGGDFTSTGAVPANRIAAWDGAAWHAFDSGINGPVYAIGSYNGDLIAAGVFSQAGGTAVSNIARYRPGQGWRALGTGVFNGPIYAVAEFQGELLAGGDFAYSASTGAPVIEDLSHWNGASWRQINFVPSGEGYPMPAGIFTMCRVGDQVFAGGIGNYVLVWADRCTTGPLGTAGNGNFTSPIYACAPDGSNLLVFRVGYGVLRLGSPAGPVQSLNGYPNGNGYALAAMNGKSYVGGAFSSVYSGAGNSPASFIAQQVNPQVWSPMGVGTNGPVLAMWPYGSELFVGGVFTEAGGPGRAGPYLARWSDLAAPTITQQPQNALAAAGSVATLSVAGVSPQGGLSYAWRHDGDPIANGPGGISLTGGVVSGADGPTLTITNVLQIDAGAFTCIVSNGCASVTSAAATLIVTPICEPDFNHDGNVDQDDVTAMINVVAGGDCP